MFSKGNVIRKPNDNEPEKERKEKKKNINNQIRKPDERVRQEGRTKIYIYLYKRRKDPAPRAYLESINLYK